MLTATITKETLEFILLNLPGYNSGAYSEEEKNHYIKLMVMFDNTTKFIPTGFKLPLSDNHTTGVNTTGVIINQCCKLIRTLTGCGAIEASDYYKIEKVFTLKSLRKSKEQIETLIEIEGWSKIVIEWV